MRYQVYFKHDKFDDYIEETNSDEELGRIIGEGLRHGYIVKHIILQEEL